MKMPGEALALDVQHQAAEVGGRDAVEQGGVPARRRLQVEIAVDLLLDHQVVFAGFDGDVALGDLVLEHEALGGGGRDGGFVDVRGARQGDQLADLVEDLLAGDGGHERDLLHGNGPGALS